MKKIQCITLNSGMIQSNQYKGPSGEEYQFDRGITTEIKNEKDAEYFLNCGDGKLFVEVGKVAQVKDAIRTALTGEKSPDKEIAIFSEAQLYAMVKAEQTKMIRELGGGDHRIPSLEKGRVDLILKLQSEIKGKIKEVPASKDGEHPVNPDGTPGSNININNPEIPISEQKGKPELKPGETVKDNV